MLVMENGLKMILSDCRSWFTRRKIFPPMTNLPKSNELKRKDEFTHEDSTPWNFSRSELGTLQGVLRDKLKMSFISLVFPEGAKGEGSRRRVTRSVGKNVEGVGTKRMRGLTMRGMRMRGMRKRGKSKRAKQSHSSDTIIFNLSTSYEVAGRLLFVLVSAAALLPAVSESVTLYCRELYSARGDGTIFDRRWATAADGGSGGLAGDAMVYPEVSDMKHSSSTYGYNYWPKGYSSSSDAPILYGIRQNSSLSKTIPNDYTNKLPAILTALNSGSYATSPGRAAIKSLDISFESDGTPVVDTTTYNLGKVIGSGVSTLDSSGNPCISYHDSTGSVPGYERNLDGSLTPVWYDVGSAEGGYAPSSVNPPSQPLQLSYDPETQQYSFDVPDYSATLAAIRESLDAIRAKEYETDLHVTVEAPPVTVNPEITVNPPQVSVSVPPPEVTVNPEITVNPPEVNVAAPVVNVDAPIVNVPAPVVNVTVPGNHSLTNIADSLETTEQLSEIDSSLPGFDSDETSIIEVYQGWDTAIPGIGEVCNMGLDLILGPIPQLGQTLNAGHYDLLEDYSIDFDFSDYAEIIRWFRAICLFALILAFAYCLWNMIVQSFQI